MNKLPDKLSELLTVALDDLRKVERSKKYVVNMGMWHSSFTDECIVCQAGAVIAKTLGVDPSASRIPSDFDEDTKRKLYAIDWLRMGRVGSAAHRLTGANHPLPHKFNRPIPDYHEDRKGFYRELRKLARDLKAEGL